MDPWDAGLAGLLAATMAVALVANALVLLCALQRAALRRRAPALFALNLAGGHLLSAALNMPLTLAGVLARRPPAGERLCRLAAFADTFLASNAALGAAALSLDRWAAVVFPLRYRAQVRARGAALLLVAGAWLPALAFPAAALARAWLGFHPGFASCTLRARRPATARASPPSPPRCTRSASCWRSACCAARPCRCCAWRARTAGASTWSPCTRSCCSWTCTPSVRERCLQEQRRRRQRATKKISTFIGTFLVCFAPYVITRLVELSSTAPIDPHWGVLSKCLAYSKAASDPFVYSLLRHQYRNSCKEMLNKVLHRHPLHSSGLAGDSHSQNILPASE